MWLIEKTSKKSPKSPKSPKILRGVIEHLRIRLNFVKRILNTKDSKTFVGKIIL